MFLPIFEDCGFEKRPSFLGILGSLFPNNPSAGAAAAMATHIKYSMISYAHHEDR